MSKQNATNKLQVSEKTCEFCKKQFTTKRNCLNHLNICKIKKDDEYSKNLNDIQILKLKTIITPSYILEYHHPSKDGFSSGKKYGEIDLRKLFSEKSLILDEKLHESS